VTADGRDQSSEGEAAHVEPASFAPSRVQPAQAQSAHIQPVPTSGRLAVLVGLLLWAIVFVVLAIVASFGADADGPVVRWLWTSLLGLFFGGVGLLYVQLKRS
jgi:hypothetical protein